MDSLYQFMVDKFRIMLKEKYPNGASESVINEESRLFFTQENAEKLEVEYEKALKEVIELNL
jgi:hypothetical protein